MCIAEIELGLSVIKYVIEFCSFKMRSRFLLPCYFAILFRMSFHLAMNRNYNGQQENSILEAFLRPQKLLLNLYKTNWKIFPLFFCLRSIAHKNVMLSCLPFNLQFTLCRFWQSRIISCHQMGTKWVYTHMPSGILPF